jgi:GT2 family glycosyltransferase
VKLRSFSKYFRALSHGIWQMGSYLYHGFRNRLGMIHLKRCAWLFVNYMNHFSNALREESRDLGDFTGKTKQKLKKTVQGLHSLLPPDPRFSYSILVAIPVQAKPAFLKKGLESVLNQTAPSLEILIATHTQQPSEITAILTQLQLAHPNTLKQIALNTNSNPSNPNSTLNQLAKAATGNYLLLFNGIDWIRPDLLFRYEQTLRILPLPDTTVLYCNEYQINEWDHPIPLSHITKPQRPSFPYLFADDIGNGVLIPKTLWEHIGGVQNNNSTTYDLALRLDLAKAHFYNIPLFLYASRPTSNLPITLFTEKAGIAALQEYVNAKQLEWKITPGYTPKTHRALPPIPEAPIHVIVPYREQKELTLCAIKSALKQKNIHLQITAIDNGSTDLTIAEELRALGVEVLTINEPFNYSRLNNLAVAKTRIGQDCETLLFLNNDVDLEEDAVAEMSRWIDQPQIGMVGCRLHYPDGSLQHGGVDLYPRGPITRMTWEHIERFSTFDKTMNLTKRLRITKAVTAACAMVKRQTFLDVGGFDEVWYPIAYSDTNLAVKLAMKGLWCLYTPYAVGIHHESVSRSCDNIEDYENSRWLHQLYLSRGIHDQIPSF